MNKTQSSPIIPLGDGGKTLLLIRHAKSSWDNSGLNDFDRPLNEKGKNDAPKMAKRLIQKKITIDAFISSPAKRAKKTAKLFMKEFDVKEKKLILIPTLYHASVEDFYTAIQEVDNSFKNIAVFSHNPGITYFANELIYDIKIDIMPTSSVFAVTSAVNNWSDFRHAEKEFLFFDYPKNAG